MLPINHDQIIVNLYLLSSSCAVRIAGACNLLYDSITPPRDTYPVSPEQKQVDMLSDPSSLPALAVGSRSLPGVST